MRNWSLQTLKEKSRSDLVDIARELNIDGLFRMDRAQIAEAIYKVSKDSPEAKNIKRTQSDTDLGTEDLKEKSRSELVDIARELGIDGLFLMDASEIVKAIENTPEKNEKKNDVQGGKAVHDQSTEDSASMEDISIYVSRIADSNKPSDAMEVVNKFVSDVSENVDSIEKLDIYMKKLFDSLGKNSEVEISARKFIVSLCSTKRVTTGADVADWVYDMYEKLDYPIHRMESLNPEDKMMNLYQGERFIAKEITYKRGSF